jgi:hypothetical protein
MKFETVDKTRVEFAKTGRSDRHFFDITSVPEYSAYSAMLYTLDHFSYWAVIKETDAGSSTFLHRIVFFPNKKWFDEWYEGVALPKPEIIYQTGALGKQ